MTFRRPLRLLTTTVTVVALVGLLSLYGANVDSRLTRATLASIKETRTFLEPTGAAAVAGRTADAANDSDDQGEDTYEPEPEPTEILGVGKNDTHHHDEPIETPGERTDKTKTRDKTKIMAMMYPLGLTGGYRNQVIRFVGFIMYSIDAGMKQILLPSILWTTMYIAAVDSREKFFPVPMAELFDVDHWNSFHAESKLPFLVDALDASAGSQSDCWGRHDVREFRLPKNASYFISPLAQKVLDENALVTPLVPYARALLTDNLTIPPKEFNLYPEIENCTNPYVYGEGLKRQGQLWNLYQNLPKAGDEGEETPEARKNSHMISLIHNALIPHRRWRDVALECVHRHLPSPGSESTPAAVSMAKMMMQTVALHARVERDMLVHPCGYRMEKNLTKIFGMVDELIEGYNRNRKLTTENSTSLRRIFLAVNTNMMKPAEDGNDMEVMLDNWKTLTERNITENSGLAVGQDDKAKVFQCGVHAMDRWYAENSDSFEYDYFGNIVPAIVNFYIATNAKIFVGVQGSSWSSDVWDTRYNQGKGKGNYEYTKKGIVPLPANRPPPPHQSCKKINERIQKRGW